jgi:hypothetical protein
VKANITVTDAKKAPAARKTASKRYSLRSSIVAWIYTLSVRLESAEGYRAIKVGIADPKPAISILCSRVKIRCKCVDNARGITFSRIGAEQILVSAFEDFARLLLLHRDFDGLCTLVRC